ncbi:hypothetical protein GCM10023209_29700 [Roseibacterium beibuensis]|uniref:Uncharacterized protein n=2 Tax=[Roseibacterium] beibuensis TaxID=1193142 RepID=A0ABP9LLT2_9RHOB
MTDFIAQHAQVISPLANLAMVAIWLIYLQVFLTTYRRQRRSSIHIDRGAAKGENARCLVTNMGQEPIYLLAVVVDFGQRDSTSRAVVTDRDELNDEAVTSPLERTTQGPLGQGEVRDLGSLADLMNRARARLNVEIERDALRSMWVTVVAISDQGTHLVAASKCFEAKHFESGAPIFVPQTILTKQIRSRWQRRTLRNWLEDRDEL